MLVTCITLLIVFAVGFAVGASFNMALITRLFGLPQDAGWDELAVIAEDHLAGNP